MGTPAKIAASEIVPISSLKLWDRNPRSIKTERFNELKERLKRQGQLKPLLVAADGETVIGGNMRLRALLENGDEEVWISRTEARTDKEIFDLALTDNEEFGYYEQEQVAELALELGLSPLELKSYALSLGEPTTLDLVIDKFGPTDEEEDEVPEVDETSEPESKLGEIYQLGSHRLMCGDSSDYALIHVLLDGTEIDTIITDPPYGIGIDGQKESKNNANPKHNRKAHEFRDWDNSRPEASHFEVILSFGAKTIIWGGNYFADLLPATRGWIYWDKGQNGLSMSDGELAWTNLDKPLRAVVSNRANIGDSVHPTQKPLNVIEFCIKHAEAQKVLDLFGGSGSTLIACEQTNRTCYMMELDPKYCDVIRKRYANHIGEGENWQEVTPVVNKELVHG